MRTIIALLSIFLIGVAADATAQSKSGYRLQNSGKSRKSSFGGGGNFFDKVYIQPNFGVAVGSNQVYLDLSPTVGYRITDAWDAGVGLSYVFTKYEDSANELKIRGLGTNVFTRYMVSEPFFLMTRYELMSMSVSSTIGSTSERIGFDALLAGGGVMQPIGRNGAFVLSVLYNFSYDDTKDYRENGPYFSPYVINTGFMIGF